MLSKVSPVWYLDKRLPTKKVQGRYIESDNGKPSLNNFLPWKLYIVAISWLQLGSTFHHLPHCSTIIVQVSSFLACLQNMDINSVQHLDLNRLLYICQPSGFCLVLFQVSPKHFGRIFLRLYPKQIWAWEGTDFCASQPLSGTISLAPAIAPSLWLSAFLFLKISCTQIVKGVKH